MQLCVHGCATAAYAHLPAATYNSFYKAPACLLPGYSCSTVAPGADLSTSLLYSRGTYLIPPEPNAPNTLWNSCK